MKVQIVFRKPASGKISVKYGVLKSADSFSGTDRLLVETREENLNDGSCSTIVTAGNFSFFLRDVNSEYPVFVPDIGAAALPENDPRSYDEVCKEVSGKHRLASFAQIDAEPEESFEHAKIGTRDRTCSTWLGSGLDIRGFWMDMLDMRAPFPDNYLDYKFWGYIRPATHYHGSKPSPDAAEPYHLFFQVGTGPHCAPEITRHLEDGYLPILHSTQKDGDMEYHLTAFATLERHTLSKEFVHGTPTDIAYSFCGFPSNIRLPLDEIERRRRSLDRSEEPVLLVKIRAKNTSAAPAYAFFTAGHPKFADWSRNRLYCRNMKYTFRNGSCTLDEYEDKTVVLNRLKGKAMTEEEMSVLVMPGEEAVMEMIVPNGPLPADRAEALSRIDFDEHYAACRKYWLDFMNRTAKIELPEKEIENRVKAGLIHQYLATTGEQTGPLMANVGIRYTPIGSESTPMIMAYEWLGLTEIAARCIEYFLGRQNEKGGIFVYSNYENETGPALWCAGEHYRITQDKEWLKRNAAALKKSCNYLLEWRNSNKTDECRKNDCYGLQKGKVDDPDDFYHSFYLNAGSWAGINSLAYAFQAIEPDYAEFLKKEAEEYQKDIIYAIRAARAKSPAIPLQDGTWIQHLPAWTEYTGDPAYHADGGIWGEHGTIFYRVQTNPPLYCGIFGVLDCDSPEITAMLLASQTPHTIRNGSYTQPYYVRNDYALAMRGETKLFLKTFYNQLAAIQDRENLGFYEHYYSNPYKGHEEGWMLMQVRWMLFLEHGSKLNLFPCAPRDWFASGKKIVMKDAYSAFGKISLAVEASETKITCSFEVENAPEEIRVRLPHPDGIKAVQCIGGTYDPPKETITLSGSKNGKVELIFM